MRSGARKGNGGGLFGKGFSQTKSAAILFKAVKKRREHESQAFFCSFRPCLRRRRFGSRCRFSDPHEEKHQARNCQLFLLAFSRAKSFHRIGNRKKRRPRRRRGRYPASPNDE